MKVPDAKEISCGYKLVFRTEEIWPLLGRKDNVTQQISDAWKVDYTRHLFRPTHYKGSRLEGMPTPVKLNFNSMTFPGFFFTAASVLQIRKLCFHGHDLDLEQWWEKCRMLSPPMQKLQTGVKGAVAVWFILRTPFEDRVCEGRVLTQRLQRRLIHGICQAAELHSTDKMAASLPGPAQDDDFHPLKKPLGRFPWNRFLSHP
ncbi:unnamed protein product [Symbiodinium necroappetens]|uniref:Uncharacterized protein n=1 Tax=Symbiodinium necroappetens TaxID=1628268 RepID=A0A812WD16_9DINO|nr:unnamed protein product [Symbiodinium necroappetens]